MRISAFHVDQFGLLRDLTVAGLPTGLSVFLGHNEAGKSTCLDFFRVMLTGYADGRTREGQKRDYMSVSGGQGGGSLQLATNQGLVRLVRRPGPNGGTLTLTDAEGNQLDIALLDRLMGGVTPQVFRNVYGFSLAELQTFDSLDSKDVRNALYGASFGLGLRSPGAALKRLETGMDALFKVGASKQPLPAGLREWEELRRQIREAEREAGRYDELAGELQTVEADLIALRRDKAAQNQESRALDRRFGVWRQWEEWRLGGVRLDRLDPVAGTFPPDGLARLERAEDRLEEASRQCRLLRERLNQTEHELAALGLNEALLTATDELRALSERKASCRNALAEIPRINLELRRAEADLAAQLASLGPDWTVDRIRVVDRSLFVREEMERQADAMHVAETAYGTAMAAMNKAVRDAGEANHAVELAARTLETLPVPAADLDETARDKLRKNLARTEDAQQRLPDRIKAQEAAKADFSRAVKQLHLRPGEPSIQVLHRLSEAQDEVQPQAAAVLTCIQDASLARTLAGQAKEAEKQARLRMSRLQNERDDRGVPTRAAIEARRDSLRRLRKLSGDLALEQNRAAEVQAGLDAHLAALPREETHTGLTWTGLLLALAGLLVLILHGQEGMAVFDLAAAGLENLPLSNGVAGLLLACGVACFLAGQQDEMRHKALIGIGGLLIAAGGAAIAAKRLFSVSSLELPTGQTVPLELWSGYLVLLAGIISLAWALGRRRPEASPQGLVTAQWQQRCEDSQAKVRSVEADVKSLCAELSVSQAVPEELDKLEARLDEEREKRATNERMEQELTTHTREIADLHRRTIELETDAITKNGQVQGAQRRWHESMVELGVQTVPAPESAQTYFMRVESARRDWSGVQALDAEMAEMEACGVDLMRSARELLPEKLQPGNWVSLGEVMDAVRAVLASCREADRAAEERARAAEALRGAEALAQRSQTIQAENLAALRTAEAALHAAREVWRESLRTLGLGLDLSPATTREALDCMNRCLDMESEVSRLRGELDRQARERDAFVMPVHALLERLRRSLRYAADGEPDWLASLDAALQDTEDNRRKDEDRRRLEATHASQAADLRAASEVECDVRRQIEDLLRLAGVDDAEAFRHANTVRLEREALVRRREDLEDALRLAADDAPLEAFLAEFAALDKEQLESRLAELATQLEATARQEERLADEAGTLRARLEQLSASDLLTELRVQEASLRESLRLLGLEWSRHALARHLLIEARLRFEKERQPEVIRAASELFASITNNAWASLSASLEDGDLRVLPSYGEPIPPEHLSQGAQEQLYLSLRLAHIRHHASLTTTPLPVIMDDVLVNFDPDRAERTARVLISLTQDSSCGPGHQILYFTCHPATADMLLRLAPDSALYHISRGRIQ